jgi:hypothetical protein
MFDRLLQLSFAGRAGPVTGAEQLQDEVISYGRNIFSFCSLSDMS